MKRKRTRMIDGKRSKISKRMKKKIQEKKSGDHEQKNKPTEIVDKKHPPKNKITQRVPTSFTTERKRKQRRKENGNY